MNIFNFEYELVNILNKDKTNSRFNVVYGENGNVIHTKKNSYEIIETKNVSLLADVFTNKGFKVSPFIYNSGEIIGLNINYLSNKLTKVGDKSYNAIITIPNNGNGCGYLSIQEKRLICENGRTINVKENITNLRIPHSILYNDYLNIVKNTIISLDNIIKDIEIKDEYLSKKLINETELRYELNKWFFENEMPINEKTEIGTLDEFRKMLVLDPDSINCIDRYYQLLNCFEKELEYNKILNLNLSYYTLLAICSNYLSRRIEKSQSKASEEIKFQRESKKLNSLLNI